DEKCLKSSQKVSFRQHSENFFPLLRKVLAKTNHSLKEIEEVYFTSLPAGKNKAISLISIDQKKTKHHCAVYQATKCLIEPKIIDLNTSQRQELTQIKKQFSDYFIYEDFFQTLDQDFTNFPPRKISFLTNFRQMFPYFQLLSKNNANLQNLQ
ncbi:17525_t:CDS:2, partial [Entrophospora sp. SA101]